MLKHTEGGEGVGMNEGRVGGVGRDKGIGGSRKGKSERQKRKKKKRRKRQEMTKGPECDQMQD